MVKVLVYRVGQEPQVQEIQDSLEAYQGLVGGYIEMVGITGDLVLVCNEEGKLDGLPLNRSFPLIQDIIAGDFFILKDGGEGAKDITDEDVELVKKYFI